ncbi:PilW family protein [Hydrogenophilus thermoluteolus]|uniref:Type IV pilus assembly protein PilW n=1 Tax=Hydrogenophilus thermoluteolus TaxID=297 RepID=A0A2Z6DZ01_HYDTE|nr:PilW family protein [Hydrogenophilus thermoluteolus]BBD77774.1 type IV pilus assembly protein PilW [Hydrogenophilus thermoluteolus]
MNARGFSLVELMVALVLGLLLIGGVIGVFLANREAYRQNENLARLQESARYAFEIMARDIREAGGIACGSNLPTANVLNGAAGSWWSNWGDGIHGFEGTDNTFPKAFGAGAADRASGTDAVIVHSGTANDGVYITDHQPTSAQFKVNTTTHGIVDGDILLVCDYKQAAIFQTTNANSSNDTIVHNTGSSVSPGNCSKYLGYPVPPNCGQPPGNPDPPSYPFTSGGFISKLSANAWYIGCNGRANCNEPAGRSLYRLKLQNNNGTAGGIAEEVAEGISDMQIQYLARNPSGGLDSQYRDANAVPDYDGDGLPDWKNVVAARVEFTFQTLEKVGTDLQPVERKWYTVVNLRNRVP